MSTLTVSNEAKKVTRQVSTTEHCPGFSTYKLRPHKNFVKKALSFSKFLLTFHECVSSFAFYFTMGIPLCFEPRFRQSQLIEKSKNVSESAKIEAEGHTEH